MSLLGWTLVGLLAGGLGRRVVGTKRRGCLATVVVGLVGAWIGGGLYRLVRGSAFEFDRFDVASILVAALGSIVFLFGLQALEGRSRG